MRINKTLDEFTPALWDRLFGAFITANRSHWRGAPHDAVLNLLKTKGRFEFTVTGMNTWTSKFILIVIDNELDAEMVPNTELSAVMQQHLKQMQETFYRHIQRI